MSEMTSARTLLRRLVEGQGGTPKTRMRVLVRTGKEHSGYLDPADLDQEFVVLFPYADEEAARSAHRAMRVSTNMNPNPPRNIRTDSIEEIEVC